MSGTVHAERGAAGVVTLRLDNPAHRNALNDGRIAALTDAFRSLAGDAACCTGPILSHHRMGPGFAHLPRDDARDHVDAGTRSVRDDKS